MVLVYCEFLLRGGGFHVALAAMLCVVLLCLVSETRLEESYLGFMCQLIP